MFKNPILAKNFGVSSEHPLATLAGFEVLSQGGNAIDATISASLTLAVTLPHLGSLGGDFFALIYINEEDKIYCINASGWVSEKISVDEITKRGYRNIIPESALSIVVPGMVDGLYKIHKRFGSKEFKELLNFPLKLAEEGFPISYSLSEGLINNYNKITKTDLKEVFTRNGEILKTGEILIQKNLAKTLRSIAEDPRIFYEGWIAESLCKYIQSKGGIIELDDFKKYEAEWVDPIKTEYKEYEIFEVPPNSQGATTLILLNILEKLNLGKFKLNSAERVHLMIEASKRAYLVRNSFLGDPKFVKIPLEELISKEYAEKLLSMSNFEKVEDIPLRYLDTTNFVIIDKKGNIVSAIQSIYHHFGSFLFDSNTGILLNSRASYFNLTGPNKIEPRKRPLHTLSCIIAKNEKLNEKIALGLSGGDYRPLLHAIILTNIIDYKLNLQEAIEKPRFLWNGYKDLTIEEGYDIEGLKKKGHNVKVLKYPSRTGVAHALSSSSIITLAYDIRGDSLAIGY